jgi:hypothetical protein
MDTMAAFNQAIAAMYGPGGDAEQRRGADAWLQHFGTTQEAWGVVSSVISTLDQDPGSSHLQFAVKTLHDKICFDFHELPQENRVQLREAISQHLLSWGLKPGVPRPVIRRLSLCAAALALQMQWGEVFQYVTALMGRAGPGQEGAVARLVLELLAALPDQCGDPSVRESLRVSVRGACVRESSTCVLHVSNSVCCSSICSVCPRVLFVIVITTACQPN